MDPDEVFQRFCRESGFTGKAGAGVTSAPKKGTAAAARPGGGGFVSPIAALDGGLPPIPFAAIGSLVVLVGLIVGLGYGGWTVLQNIQRVQFAPVEELPVAVAEIEPLEAPDTRAARRARLHRPRRAGHRDRARRSLPPAGARGADPGAARRPDRRARPGQGRPARPAVGLGRRRWPRRPPRFRRRLIETPAGGDSGARRRGRRRRRADAGHLVAERAAWIRVYLDNGTVIFESILESGQSYTPPDGTDAAAGLGRQLRLGLRPDRRHALRPARQRHPRRQGHLAGARRRSPRSSRWSTEVPEVISQSIAGPPDRARAGRRDPLSAAALRVAPRGDNPGAWPMFGPTDSGIPRPE